MSAYMQSDIPEEDEVVLEVDLISFFDIIVNKEVNNFVILGIQK